MAKYNNYSNYTESDFLTDEFFQTWVFNPDEVTNFFWSGYLSENPLKIGTVTRAKMILESFEFKENYPAEEKVREYLNATLAKMANARDQKEIATIRPFRKIWWATAASVIVILCLGFFLFKNQDTRPITKVIKPSELKNDAAPGGNKATLTLADGSTIILDSAANGNIISQGNTQLIKVEGQLAYTPSGIATDMVYNTISIPKGGQYKLILADGTRVWLNSASSLRFPASFAGAERKVELTGEGYFEVAKNDRMPFKVNVGGKGEVEVLGTHFNVNAYDDEVSINTTLLEGKVRTKFANQSLALIPNQQSVFMGENNSLQIKKEIDVNKVIAWKNGLFDFEDDDITDIMRQLARWYDVQIQFNGNISRQHFTGAIRRQVPLSQVLFMLEHAGGVEFKIIGKTIEIKTK